MARKEEERTINLPFQLANPKSVVELIHFVYVNHAIQMGQSIAGQKVSDAPMGWLMAQGLLTTIVNLLEQRKSDDDVEKIVEGLKLWCNRS